nr:enoyl-CoA hydratase/isomerase family protein [Candidatus Sigynarchaeota archaeon]
INGRSMGMGIVYTLASDLRYAVDGATFKLPEVDASIIPAATCMTLLVNQVGLPRAKEMLFLCRQYSAQEFKGLGLLTDVYPTEGFIERVIQIAKEISRKNQDVLLFTKACMNHVPFVKSFEEATRIEEATFLSTFQKDKQAYLKEMKEKFGMEPFK